MPTIGMIGQGNLGASKGIGISTFLGMCVVGLTVLAFSFDLGKSRFLESKQASLSITGDVFAHQSDAFELDKIQDSGDLTSDSFRNLQETLRRGAQALPEQSQVAVIRKEAGGWVTLASSGSESESKTKFMEPVDDLPDDVSQLWKNSVSAVSPRLREDRWGEWFSGFSAVRNMDGVTTAIVVLDLPAESINVGLESIRTDLYLAMSCYVLFAAIFAWVVAGFISRNREGADPRRDIRRGIYEIVLLTAILAMVCKGAIEIKQQVAERAELVGLYHEIKEFAEAGPQSGTEIDSTLSSLAAYVEEEAAETAFMWIMVGLAIPSLIGLLAALRIAIRKETDYNDVKTVSDRAQSDYARLLEYLPIGVFAWRDGICTFGNAEWERQVSYADGQDRRDAFEFSLHANDREETLKSIDRAVQAELPFNVQFRIVDPSGVRFFESHGAPIYDEHGYYSHSLAFLVDTTARTSTEIALKDAYKNLEEKNRLLSSALTELEDNLENVVRSLVKAVEAKDPYTAGHSERVMQYSMMLGEAIGLGPYEMRILEMGTLVHDIGKIGIPDEILTKPDRLTDEEFELIKKHPEFGENIIGNIDLFKTCLPIVRWHHERLDGSGYPDRLLADDIPLLVRISSIADMFDAMTSTRAYRSGMPKEKVLDIMQGCVEKGELDAHLFAIFCHVIQERGVISQGAPSNTKDVA